MLKRPGSSPKLVCVGACDAGSDRGVVRADGARNPHDRSALGGSLGPLYSRANNRPHGRTRQPFLSRGSEGTRLPDGGVCDGHVLLRIGNHHSTAQLYH